MTNIYTVQKIPLMEQYKITKGMILGDAFQREQEMGFEWTQVVRTHNDVGSKVHNGYDDDGLADNSFRAVLIQKAKDQQTLKATRELPARWPRFDT